MLDRLGRVTLSFECLPKQIVGEIVVGCDPQSLAKLLDRGLVLSTVEQRTGDVKMWQPSRRVLGDRVVPEWKVIGPTIKPGLPRALHDEQCDDHDGNTAPDTTRHGSPP